MRQDSKGKDTYWPLWSAALVLALSASMASRGNAATIVVDGSTCTLNDAIQSANMDAAVGGCSAGSGDDVIDLQADVTLTENLKEVSSVVTISGNGKTVDGDEKYSLFVNYGGDLTINDATITGGRTSFSGGGVLNAGGSVKLNRCTLTGNFAEGRGGGAASYAYDKETELIITDSTISSNSALKSGGGIDNTAHYASSHVLVSNSTISGNSSPDKGRGGGIANYSKYYQAEVVIKNSTISGNASGIGGGIVNYAYYSTAHIDISSSRITGNTADQGGGIYNYGYQDEAAIEIAHSTISGNTAEYDGGGISNGSYDNSSRVKIDTSVISRNTAGLSGKGGGGVNWSFGGTAVFEVNDSLVTDNTAGSSGGGLANSGYMAQNAELSIKNSTISGNEAKAGAGVSSYILDGHSLLTITTSTVSGNSATDEGGGVFLQDGNNKNQIVLLGNIISGNSAPVAAEFSRVPDVIPSLDQRYNLLGSDAVTTAEAFKGIESDSTDVELTSDSDKPLPLEAVLMPLAYNGGSTMTRALPKDSPAVDFIPEKTCSEWSINTDQRGFHRPVGLGCDAGAYEYKPSSLLLKVVPIISSGVNR